MRSWFRPFPLIWLSWVACRHTDNLDWIIPLVGAALVVAGLAWAVKTTRASATKSEIAYLGPVALSEGARCLICRHALSGDVIYCGRCHTPHHRDCFAYVGGCSLYACGSRKAA